jgi:hypothetical protein
MGGLDLNPVVYTCSAVSMFSFRTILYLVIFGAVIYFGWPIFEAIIIALPVPDPKDLKEKIRSFFVRDGCSTSISKGRKG